MSLIQRLGSSRQVEVLSLTVHTVNACLPDFCLMKLTIALDKKQKVHSPYKQYDPSYPVTSFDYSQSLQVNFFKKKLRTLRKTLKVTLVTLKDVKEVVDGEATLDIQDLSVGGPGLVRTLVPLTKCSDPQASVCLSVSRALAPEPELTTAVSSSEEAASRSATVACKFPSEVKPLDAQVRKRQMTVTEQNSAVGKLDDSDSSSDSQQSPNTASPHKAVNLHAVEPFCEPIIVKRFSTVSSGTQQPVSARKGYEYRGESEDSGDLQSGSEEEKDRLDVAEFASNRSAAGKPQLALNLTKQKVVSATMQRLIGNSIQQVANSSSLPAPLPTKPATEPIPTEAPKPTPALPVLTSMRAAQPNARASGNKMGDAGRSRTAACAGCSLQ